MIENHQVNLFNSKYNPTKGILQFTVFFDHPVHPPSSPALAPTPAPSSLAPPPPPPPPPSQVPGRAGDLHRQQAPGAVQVGLA